MAAKPSSGRPWIEVVTTIRGVAERERWRLASVRSLTGWREVAVCWKSVGQDLVALGQPHRCPLSRNASHEELLAWAWEVVEPAVDASIRVMDDRLSLPAAMLISIFEALRGASLLFPDGSVHQGLMERIERDENTLDLERALRQHSMSESVDAIVQRAKAKAAKTATQGGVP